MMADPRTPLFLERRIYRRRRVIDAAKLLPFVGLILFLMPAFVTGGLGQTSSLLVFYFLAWFVLIVIAGLLARALAQPSPKRGKDSEAEG